MARVLLLIGEATGCEGDLTDSGAILACMRRVADLLETQVLRESVHVYPGGGLTAVLFLAESHLLVSTWPECRVAICEVCVCGGNMEVGLAWETLTGVLRPSAERSSTTTIPIAVGVPFDVGKAPQRGESQPPNTGN